MILGLNEVLIRPDKKQNRGKKLPKNSSISCFFLSFYVAMLCISPSNYFNNRYSPSSGRFVADQAGLYFFEMYWLAQPPNQVWVHMYKNTNPVCASYTRSMNDANDFNSPSCSVVLELAVGDEVWVTKGQNVNIGHYDATAFAGFLIKPYF